MSQCKLAPTWLLDPKNFVLMLAPYDNPTLYRSLATSLHCLTFTYSDISYATQQLCLFMHDPQVEQMSTLGFVTCFLSSFVLFLRPLLFIVKMLVLFIFRTNMLIINALNISRWTFILFLKRFNVAMFECLIFHLAIRLPMF